MTAAWHLELQKDRRTRAEEERLAGRLLLNVVAEACDVSQTLALDLLEGEQVEESRTRGPAGVAGLAAGQGRDGSRPSLSLWERGRG